MMRVRRLEGNTASSKNPVMPAPTPSGKHWRASHIVFAVRSCLKDQVKILLVVYL